MVFVQSELMLYMLFFVYGVYAAATEGVSKAWISKIVPASETATAIGFHASCASIITLLSSTIAGLLWVSFYPQVTFVVASIGVLIVIGYFLLQKK
jgi:MFS family permease